VAAAHAAGVDGVHLVVGHDADAVVAAARRGGAVEVAHNPDHAAGQASSLRVGIAAAARAGARVAVVLLADEPDVPAAAIAAVAQAVLDGAPAARAAYDDAVGHPVAFGWGTFTRIGEVEGDRGARDLLGGLGAVDVPVAGRRPRDLDRPEDLDARRRR
jgi:molybdenum cofactor cytidylyltransferase